jgi:hypothetical protein
MCSATPYVAHTDVTFRLNLWSGERHVILLNLQYLIQRRHSVNYASSIALVEECLIHTRSGEDKARLLWIRSRVHWARNEFSLALEDTLQALRFLNTIVDINPSLTDLDIMLDDVQERLSEMGLDNVLEVPRAADDRIDLISSLLIESCNHAYWVSGKQNLVELLGWKVSHSFGLLLIHIIKLETGNRAWTHVSLHFCFTGVLVSRMSIRSGTSPSTGLGYLYATACESPTAWSLSIN